MVSLSRFERLAQRVAGAVAGLPFDAQIGFAGGRAILHRRHEFVGVRRRDAVVMIASVSTSNADRFTPARTL